jgi:hypothetical protein
MLPPVVAAYEGGMYGADASRRATWRTDRYSRCPRTDAGRYLILAARIWIWPAHVLGSCGAWPFRPGRLTSPSPICLAEHLVEFGVGPELPDLLRTAAGDGDLGSPLQRLLA